MLTILGDKFMFLISSLFSFNQIFVSQTKGWSQSRVCRENSRQTSKGSRSTWRSVESRERKIQGNHWWNGSDLLWVDWILMLDVLFELLVKKSKKIMDTIALWITWRGRKRTAKRTQEWMAFNQDIKWQDILDKNQVAIKRSKILVGSLFFTILFTWVFSWFIQSIGVHTVVLHLFPDFCWHFQGWRRWLVSRFQSKELQLDSSLKTRSRDCMQSWCLREKFCHQSCFDASFCSTSCCFFFDDELKVCSGFYFELKKNSMSMSFD